jgi:hypothetical protein
MPPRTWGEEPVKSTSISSSLTVTRAAILIGSSVIESLSQ